MTREEKVQTGIEKAEKNWSTIDSWKVWEDVTAAARQYAVSGSHSREGTIKLYNEKAEMYANRPVKVINCGFANIENEAYIDRLFELVSKKIGK